MITFIPLLVLLPVAGYLVSLLISNKNENLISQVAFFTVGTHMTVAVLFLIYWITQGRPAWDGNDLLLFKTPAYGPILKFSFDKLTATYLFAGAVLTFLVTHYSRTYLHREQGYKRFFNTILFFYIGFNLVIFSGNLATLFIGWEILGISSFLLIAFYRERYLPVRNAVKFFSIYRIGDAGLILAMWASRNLETGNITFLKSGHYDGMHEHLLPHNRIGLFISLMILLAALVKSAQLPFSSWLPRAMEGPTPSSAIFYGALSVHLGVFLLLRTFIFWEYQLPVRILIALVGLTTAIVTTGISRVQSSVKTRIAYASVAQVGLMFVEVAAGLENLALIHFAGNAFLRTYQLLVFPSVVSHSIREQFYNFAPRTRRIEDFLPKKLRYTFYILCVKEWNLDTLLYRGLWNPLKVLGNRLNFFTFKGVFLIFMPAYLAGLFLIYHKELISIDVKIYLPFLFLLIALILVLKSFTARLHTRMGWLMLIMSHFWVALAIVFNENSGLHEVYFYIGGVVVAGIAGYLTLSKLKSLENNIDLDQFHGHVYKHPKLALIFLLCCLGLSGFPITPTFLGKDLILSHIHKNQIVLALITTLSLIIEGLAIIRIYARVFLGPHAKSIDEMAYRSS
jgi:NADH:ubiquinone oxidoreductase subunit 5 (subunit L)/multisubunit Na+/H+ antiporter MnhA subunit